MFDDDTIEYYVVVNHEEQYSIWPADREIPKGWRSVKGPMQRQAGLDDIEKEWTDIRPRSLRDRLHG